jgi:tetratricopeptide (TPR) repeat protein
MKNIFIVLLLIWSISQIGCGGGDKPANANQTNANSSPTQTPITNTNVNSNTQAQATPLPEFTDAETAFAEGNKLFDANKTELAIEAYNQAVKLNPDLAEAYFKLGVSYALIEKQKEIDSLNEEIEVTPTPTPGKKPKKDVPPPIRVKDSEKAFEKAVKAYKKLLAKNPKDDVALFNLGRAYNKLDEDEDSEKSLREAVKLKPDDTVYQTELGAILIKLAKYDEAVRVLKKALDLDAENSEADELLEKAEAGKKRINFSSSPKPQQQQQDNDLPKSKKTTKPQESDTPDKSDQDIKKQGESKPEKKPEKKIDKKGNQ